MTNPTSLYPGAKVALVAPGGPVAPTELASAQAALRSMGLEPAVFPSCDSANRYGYFSADDGQRAKDLQDAFADPAVQGILCPGGGYGARRLFPLLDWKEMSRRPKLFCGGTDFTPLHLALNRECRLVTCLTPAVREGMDGFSLTYLRRALFGALTGPMPLGEGAVTLQGGTAKGPLCGGSLAGVAGSLGTPWEIETGGRLLLLTGSGETPQQADALLAQLRDAGKLDDCAGILLGNWEGCRAQETEGSLTLDQVFEELLLPAGKPILAGLPDMALPLGAAVLLDADAQTLEVPPHAMKGRVRP